jgi:hypothetical protein
VLVSGLTIGRGPRRPQVRVGAKRRGGVGVAEGALHGDQEADRSVYFTSDRTAVKTTLRVGFGFVHEPAVIKVKLATT